MSDGGLYIHERATHLNFCWYLMTDLKVVIVYSSNLESRHQSPHNMNFLVFKIKIMLYTPTKRRVFLHYFLSCALFFKLCRLLNYDVNVH